PGTNVGAVVVTRPNASSRVFAGASYLVQWDYTSRVSHKPATVDVKIATVAQLAQAAAFPDVVVQGLDVSDGSTA
ncbi:hypothetical protein HK405_001100, partial [Cladochytrium tenue]